MWREKFLSDDVQKSIGLLGGKFDNHFMRRWEYYLAICEGKYSVSFIK
jgi:cyclopropane fatty-acyl-phospholipid synthase-like methyltransferase